MVSVRGERRRLSGHGTACPWSGTGSRSAPHGVGVSPGRQGSLAHGRGLKVIKSRHRPLGQQRGKFRRRSISPCKSASSLAQAAARSGLSLFVVCQSVASIPHRIQASEIN